MQILDMEKSVEEARKLLESVYAEIIANTDLKTLKVNEEIFNGVDRKKALTNLDRISITCRRIENELKEAKPVEL